MQIIRSLEQDNAAQVGWGIRVMLATTVGAEGVVAKRLAGLGGKVECLGELYTAMSMVADDPYGYGLFVIEADAFGDLAEVRRTVAMLPEAAARVPLILISRDCPNQIFPADRGQPIVLRAPLSAVSLRVGFEHALRDRLAQRMN
ncbi:MAG: hypothetical protein ACRC14_05520 [Paracoccaceae bacterium]